MEERRQLARDCDYRPFLRIAAAAFGEAQAPAAEITVGAKRPEDVLGPADEQAAEHGVAAFGDAQLGLPCAGVVLPRAQAEVCTHRAARPEAARVLEVST
jgi:hypothetical protein